jgi:hypothetical protein
MYTPTFLTYMQVATSALIAYETLSMPFPSYLGPVTSWSFVKLTSRENSGDVPLFLVVVLYFLIILYKHITHLSLFFDLVYQFRLNIALFSTSLLYLLLSR